MKLCILGRQPALSLAELEALVGTTSLTPLGDEATLVDDSAHPLRQRSLGGTLKIGEVIAELPTHDLDAVFTEIHKWLETAVGELPEGKISLGLSAYGTLAKTSPAKLQQHAFRLKKAARAVGRSMRIVPNKTAALSTAQVIHNQLDEGRNIELLCVGVRNKVVIARTTSVQNIDEYSARDYGRPKRSGFVGMLPPKLAQIMLNLAQVAPDQVVLDPFCGTGVVLQEAVLLGCQMYGTDIEPKMIDFSRTNLEWLQQKYRLKTLPLTLAQGDAADYQWQPPIDKVVCETYLGQPMTSVPIPEKLHKIQNDCTTIITQFLQNLQLQLASGTRCVVAVPAWFVQNQFQHLPVVDQLEELGYNRVSFERASNQDLIYHRHDQIVARELLVLTRK